MTPGHKHRTIHLRRSNLLHRRLIGLLQVTLAETTDEQRAERSRWVWGTATLDPYEDPTWRLTPLGLLHSLFGLTIDVKEPTDAD